MDGTDVAGRLRAARLTGGGRVEMIDAPLPRPRAGEVRVRVEGCGVCASNLGPWAGPDWIDFPLDPGDPGHEAWGRIEATGPDVDAGRRGERVAVFGGGGFATHMVVAADAALPVPPALDGRPVPAEPFGCAVSIFRAARVRPGDRVAIIGIGFLGALLTQLSAGAGAQVIALSRRRESLERATALGARHVVPLDDHAGALAAVAEATGGAGADIVIECVGHQWPLDLAAEITRESGRLVIAGYHQDGPRQVDMQLWNWRAFEVVNAHVRDRAKNLDAMRAAMALMADGVVAPESFLTHRYPLDRLAEALDATRDKPAGFLKAIVVPPC